MKNKIIITKSNIKESIRRISNLLKTSEEKIILEYHNKSLLKLIESRILENFGEKPLEYGIIKIIKK